MTKISLATLAAVGAMALAAASPAHAKFNCDESAM